jgi:hypothetical protein
MSQLGADGGAIGAAALIDQDQVPRSREDGLAAAFTAAEGNRFPSPVEHNPSRTNE